MMLKPQWTTKSYLAFDLATEMRHEYLNGEVYSKADSSRQHSLIVGNTTAALHSQLRESLADVFSLRLRLRVSSVQYSYPDISVVYGESKFGDEKPDTLLNPTVLIEVLLPSTEHYDCGEKLNGYRTLSSLKECLLISSNRVHIEHYRRQSSHQWLIKDVDDRAAILELHSIQCTLTAADVYNKVNFDDESS